MKCPVCKKEVPDESIICPECKARIGLVCYKCKTVNPINTLRCKKCNTEILRLCPHCRTINLPTASVCRKCHASLLSDKEPYAEPVKEQVKEPQQPKFAKIKPTQDEIINLIYNAIVENEKFIISLNAPKGMGKDFVLDKVLDKLGGTTYTVLKGTCSPLSQLTPGGLIQEILISLLGLPNFCINNVQFQKDAFKFFKNEFAEFANDEIVMLINLLYPYLTGNFEDILTNKSRTFNLVTKVFAHIFRSHKVLFVINNFDFIDALSYEYFNNFIKIDDIFEHTKFLMTYSEPRPAQAYFFLEEEKYGDIYFNLELSPLTPVEAVGIFKMTPGINKILPDIEKKELYKKSKGSPAFIEQGIAYKQDCIQYDLDFKLPDNITDLIKKRLEILKIRTPLAFNVLLCASILGKKININLIKEVFELNDDIFNNTAKFLIGKGFISEINEFFCEFKNSLLWEVVLTVAKNEPNFVEINKKLYSILKIFTLSSNTTLAIILQNLQNKKEALNVWTHNVNLCSYIGDVNLYIISQKQCLALINELDDRETLKIRFNIAERLGKILTQYKPDDAIEFLPDAISNAQGIGNSIKEIELLGYLTCSCQRAGNYYGVVESVDRVLEKVNPAKDLEIAMIKAAKLDALLNIGDCAEVINLIQNDIMPVFNKYLNGVYRRKDISYELLYNTWLRTYLILANAYIFQGNNKAFEITTLLFNIIERGQVKDTNFIIKCHLAFAFASTVAGDYAASNKHLQEIMDACTEFSMSNENILRWNFINMINRFLNHEYEHIQEDLFEIVAFANNNFDTFTKNIMKTLLGKVLVDNDQTPKGLEIYNEQLEHFSNEKIALGALLCWYLISDAVMNLEGPDKAIEIASKALDVAQNPKIQNYFFNICLKMVLTKAYIIKEDFETARIYLDNALQISQQYELHDMTARLYLLYGKLYQDAGLKKSPKQREFLKMAAVMYERCIKSIRKTQNNHLFREHSRAEKVLTSFCEMNNINLKNK